METILKGKIHVIYGPMWSGKSTELLRQIRRYIARYFKIIICIVINGLYSNKKCIIIKYSKDTRYSDINMSTHDKQMFTAISSINLYDIQTQLGIYIN